jgi:histidinol dehydrogenase
MNIGSIEDHRSREGGSLVYPVYSRRSRGLSLGINLYPDRKMCSFDCPYCEVFPFETGVRFSVETMAKTLGDVIAAIRARGETARDICFSGNGEPSLSPYLGEALEAASRIRDALTPGSALVLITNGSGLLNEDCFELLRRAATGPMALKLWLKLDAGTRDWYAAINRSDIPFGRLITAVQNFAALAPFTIQTMICSVNGASPPPEEGAAWERLALELAAWGHVTGFQIYGKARPSPRDPLAESLPVSVLDTRAASLEAALKTTGLRGPQGKPVPVEVFQ